jgi:pyruvate-ferredoxin/flavodoxin oxidoreductase
MSKSTPCGAVAKFAAGGKLRPKKDLALMAMTYRSVYVARVALGANDNQALKAFLEAEAFDGPSLIISYGHCIAHGYDLVHALDQQKAAVLSGHWPLMRYNPALIRTGRNPFQLDSKPPSLTLEQYRKNESRYTMLAQSHPETAREFGERSQQILMDRWNHYEYLAAMQPGKDGNGATPEKPK